MFKGNFLLILILLGISFTSCKKQTITIHENVVVSGNTPPTYSGISTVQIEVYVNKMYIDLLGIQPTAIQLNDHTIYLKKMELTAEARDTVIDQILGKLEYYNRLFSILSAKMLESTSRYQIDQEILSFASIVSLLYATGDTLSAQVVELERDKLIFLNKSDSLYQAGGITLNQFYAAFSDNQIYDEINMGSLNFVIASFSDYFYRAPSLQETANGSDMVDGQSKPLLGTDGNSKLDFIGIITNSDEFYQGLVIDNFRTYLARTPSSYEMFVETQFIKLNDDLGGLKKNILKTDEYAGF